MNGLMELSYKQVTSNRPLGNGQFPDGVIDYNFNIGGKTGWIPSLSYFRVALKLKGAGGAAPVLKDQVAMAESVCGNLFSNVYFRAGGQDVSSIVNFVPQAQAVKTRLTKSGAWLNTIGKDSYRLEPDFQKRVNNTASDVPSFLDDSVQTVKLGTDLHQHDYKVVEAVDTGVLTGTNTNFTAPLVNVGDQILINGQVKTVTLLTNATSMTVTPTSTLAFDSTANGSVMKLARGSDGSGRAGVYTMWQPPIGIFDHHSPMGSGDYRIQLNPNSAYKTSCVQSKLAGLTNPAHYDFEVTEVQFFVATCKIDDASSGVTELFLMEHQVSSKPLSNGLHDFTVPSSTVALSVFVQSGDSSTNTQSPPNLFKTKGRQDETLQSIQISYANTVKPSTLWTSAFTDDTNYLTQRYTDTQLESGKFFSEGGCESFGDWLKRGPLIHYNFVRDKDDRSTNVQLAINYLTEEANSNVFLVAHYKKRVNITTQNGFIVNVDSFAT
jgi:hypothetical protein